MAVTFPIVMKTMNTDICNGKQINCKLRSHSEDAEKRGKAEGK